MDILKEIELLERWQHHKCACGTKFKTCTLKIHCVCPSCGIEEKQRAFGSIGTEAQDVIDAVLKWAGTGEGLESLLERHREIHEC